MSWITHITVLIVLIGVGTVDGQTATHADETALRAAIQSGYDQHTRPYSPTYVDIVYNLRSVKKLNVADQTLSHTAFLELSWHDPRLLWNASVYSNISVLDVNWSWRPMFRIVNSVESADLHGSDNDETRILVYSNGTIVWRLLTVTTTACEVDIASFPYDNQECDIFLLFTGQEDGVSISFNLSSFEVNRQFYLENDEWQLSSTSVGPLIASVCCPQYNMPYITVAVAFKRLYTFYVNTFLIPTILLSICLVWPFYLPTESGERIGFSLTVLLSYTVLLSITADFLPTTSKQVPVLAFYLLIVLFMCSLAVCNVTINVKIYHLETEVPECVKKFYKKVKPVVFLEYKRRSKNNKVESSHTVLTIDDAIFEKQRTEQPPINPDLNREDTETSTETTVEVTWKLFSELLDRICFIVYSTGVFLVDIILMIYLSSN